ncbi:MAG: GDP-L-fucose synthase [bacterium]
MIDKKAKIYIAGHGGMVGSAITNKFSNEGYSHLILKTRRELDLFDQQDVEDFFKTEKPEYVMLAAAKVGGIKENMTHQADFIYENIQIQNNVIWSAHLHNVKKLLFLGSSCIYPRECPQPMKEEYFMNGKVEPTNEGYAIAKIAGMKLCEKISSQYSQNFISCMPTNIYGPNDNFKDDSAHVIPSLIRRIHQAKINNDKEVIIWGSGNSRREFLFVDDLADAVYWLINTYDKNEFLNIGTGEDVSIKELAFEIKKIVEYKGSLAFDTTKPDGMPKKLLDVKKINNLGWKYKTSFKTGLEATYKWFLAHNNL